MSTPSRIAVTGTGYALPANIRTNTDPVFDWLRAHPPPGDDLFKGYNTRHVLADGEEMLDLMVPAAQRALDAAGVEHREVDLLLGYASVSRFHMPNELARLHQELNLSPGAWVVPLNNEYSNFNASLVMANALIQAGQASNALIVCGGNWTRHVNYHAPESVSAADGAGAAVLGRTEDATRFRVVDYEVETRSDAFGVMYMQPDPIPGVGAEGEQAFTHPFFHITQAGYVGFKEFGEKGPPAAANRLLARNGLRGSDVAVIAHQTSTVLIDAWRGAIGPAQYLETLSTFANMTLASIPVNLAYCYDQIATDALLLLGIGPEMHAHALLLRRNG